MPPVPGTSVFPASLVCGERSDFVLTSGQVMEDSGGCVGWGGYGDVTRVFVKTHSHVS